MRNQCETERVFTYCKNTSHNNKACRKLTNNSPSPINSHIPMGYHPTATPPPLSGSTPNPSYQIPEVDPYAGDTETDSDVQVEIPQGSASNDTDHQNYELHLNKASNISAHFVTKF